LRKECEAGLRQAFDFFEVCLFFCQGKTLRHVSYRLNQPCYQMP
jgi:hypothetical protein